MLTRILTIMIALTFMTAFYSFAQDEVVVEEEVAVEAVVEEGEVVAEEVVVEEEVEVMEEKGRAGVRRTGKTAWEIAEIYTDAFKQDLQRLNILPPHVWCRATDHIGEQIDAIRSIEAKGHLWGMKRAIRWIVYWLNGSFNP